MRTVKKILKITAKTLAILVAILMVALLVLYIHMTNWVHVEESDDRPSVTQYYNEDYQPAEQPRPYFESHDFDVAVFQSPPLKYGPFTRWWWPGNDVTAEELKREINLFAQVGIAGVEIQPFGNALNSKASADVKERVFSYDQPSFYQHVRTVMEEARKTGVTVDMNGGSGWPLGGPQNNVDDNFRTLLYSETTEKGGEIEWEPELPKAPLSSYIGYFFDFLLPNFSRGQLHEDKAELQAVLAAKPLKDERSRWAYSITDQVWLDPESLIDLTDKVQEGVLKWSAPDGNWRIIAIWSLPNDEIPVISALKDPGYVVDHFDSIKVTSNYNYLFGKRTGLQEFYGKPFRAIFNDSYEFKAERHFSKDFISEFKIRRGYDVTPFLPITLKPGYNHMFGHFGYSYAKPDFVLTEDDWRIRHDYDQTISDLMIDVFIKGSNNWMETRGLSHRTQAYGMGMDYIKSAGTAAIPEAEQLYAEGSATFLKLVSSGAHLYNRPIVTAESVVYSERHYMTTPQKIKISVDKAFTSGINQVIYHGTSYMYKNEDFGELGWFAWNSPYSTGGFSFDNRETNAFWKYQPAINKYIARSQSALQSGKPKVDVLIYYPYLGIGYDNNGISEPSELLINGYFKGVEPEGTGMAIPFVEQSTATDPQIEWFQRIYKLTNRLDAMGITWNWVNDESIVDARYENEKVAIRGNSFQAILVPEAPFIQMGTAQRLQQLATEGAHIAYVYDLPSSQPSYLNFKENDQKTRAAVNETLTAIGGKHFKDETEMTAWLSTVKGPVRFTSGQPNIKQVQRIMTDSSRIVFYRNNKDGWSELGLQIDGDYRYSYWLDPMDGSILPFNANDTYLLPPYGSVMLYISNAKPLPEEMLIPSRITPLEAATINKLENWDIKVGATALDGSGLINWRDHKSLKHTSDPGSYTSSFTMASISEGKRYFLDLGEVYFTADLKLNGRDLGSLLWAPYTMDITDYLKQGENSLQITTTTAQRNGFIGKALNGDKLYERFEDQEDILLPSGLVGPVTIKEL